MTPLRRLLLVIRTIFTPLSFAVILVIVWQSRAALGTILRQGHWSLLIVSLLLWMLSNVLAPLVSMYIFKSCRMRMSYLTALEVHCKRLPAKYLPGGIWHSVGRANDYLIMGYGPGNIGLFFVLENFLLVAVTLFMSAWIVSPLIDVPLLRALVSVMSPLLGLLLLVFPLGCRLLSRGRYSLALGPYCGAVILLALYWSLLGLTFVCYLSAFDSLPLAGSVLDTASVYIFSWCLGYLAVFAPQGIGVAEFISGSLLTDGAAGTILAFLVGFRLLALVADLLGWLSIKLWRPKA